MRRLIAILLFLTPALAAERPLTGAEITALLADRTVAGTDQNGKPWTQVFQKGGLTIYSQGTAVSTGYWRVTGDQYCSQWPPNETWSCYGMTGEGDHATFVSSSGASYPVTVTP